MVFPVFRRHIHLLAMLLALGPCIAAAQVPDYPVHRVLFLSSYHPGYPSVERQVAGVRQSFEDAGFGPSTVYLDIEYLDSKRFPRGDMADGIRTNLRAKLSGLPPYDLIISADDNALNLITDERETFSSAPVVFLGVNNAQTASRFAALDDITGVVETIPMRENLNLIATLMPAAPFIAVVSDPTETGKSLLADLLAAHDSTRHPPLKVLSLGKYAYPELLEEAERLDSGTPTLLLTGYVDRTGRSRELFEVAKMLDEHLAGPLFHVQRWAIGNGVFAGVVIDQELQGSLAGAFAARILAGEDPRALEYIDHVPGRPVIDWSRRNEFETTLRLPPDTMFLNRQPGWWQLPDIVRYIILIGVILAMMAMTVLAAMADQNAQRTRLSEKNLRTAYRTITRQQYQASMAEFISGLAHEMNTPIGISVTAASHLQDILKRVKTGEAFCEGDILGEVSDTTDLIARSNIKAANIIRILRNTSGETDGEEPCFIELRSFVDEIRLGLSADLREESIKFAANIPEDAILYTRASALRQVMLSIIRNSIDHAFTETAGGRDRRIDIEAHRSETRVRIRMADNGSGITDKLKARLFEPFSTSRRSTDHNGLGLYLVYNEVERNLEGIIEFGTHIGEGTWFELSLPNLGGHSTS